MEWLRKIFIIHIYVETARCSIFYEVPFFKATLQHGLILSLSLLGVSRDASKRPCLPMALKVPYFSISWIK